MTQPFNDIAPQYDLLNDLLSLGLHRVWKKSLVSELSKQEPHPEAILDLASGTGDMAALFAHRFSEKIITPVDPSAAMMEKGKLRFPNLVNWTVASAEKLPFKAETFSIVTCTFGVRNFQNRSKAFQEIARVMKPKALFGILEIHPISKKLLYLPYRIFWDYGVPALGALFRHKKAYEYLRNTGARFISPEDMVKELSPYFEIKKKRNLMGGGLVSLMILEKK